MFRIPFTRYCVDRWRPKHAAAFQECLNAVKTVQSHSHRRTDVINACLQKTSRKRYLEIGLRDPQANYDHIEADFKTSVDPGLEAPVNRARHQCTSDEFFDGLLSGSIDPGVERFDVIFVDGLHTAEQTYRDIRNALQFVSDDGFIVAHDCSPPTRFHARESFAEVGPALGSWNGTTWKAIQILREELIERFFVVDIDWGVGVISIRDKDESYRLNDARNPFYEFAIFEADRARILNLIDFHAFESYLAEL